MPDAQKAAANGFPPAMQGLLYGIHRQRHLVWSTWKSAFRVGVAPRRRLAGEGAAARALRDVAGERRRKGEGDHGNNRGEHRRRQRLDDLGERGRAILFSAPGEPDGPACPDDRSLESAVRRGTRRGVSGGHDQARRVEQRRLGHVANFQRRGKPRPAPQSAFAYFDSAMFYTRLDAAVRPMLIMAAAFMPKVAETVDLGKLPAAEAITKHLSPIVLSQTYQGDGYMTESVGPVSIYQAALGMAALTGMGASFYQHQVHGVPDDTPTAAASTPAAPSVMPSPDPDETPDPEP